MLFALKSDFLTFFVVYLQVEEYREEIDSSAVRIRENKVFSTKLQEIREEIDSVQVRQNRPIKGEIVKNKVFNYFSF